MKPIMQFWKEEYLNQERKYENHVSKFIYYLMLPTVDKVNKPAAVDTTDLVRCIGYYVKLEKINSVKSMESHLESVKAFYKYLISCKYVVENIVPSVDYAKFKSDLSKKYDLKESVAREWFSDDEIKTILDKIDDYFAKSQYDSLGKEGKDRYFHWSCVRIFIKLSLIAPAKKSILISSTFGNFSQEFRSIVVNSVTIKIPNGLRYNIIDALSFIQNTMKKQYKKNDNFFHYLSDKIGGESDPKGTMLNQWFCSFLRVNDVLDIPQNVKSYPVDTIANTTIHNMIKNGTNPAHISKIAGISMGSLEKYYEDNVLLENYISTESLLNNEIAKCDYYNYV